MNTLMAVRDNIKEWRDAGYSWRDIEELPAYEHISLPTLRRISLGIEPGPKVRKQLGLPPAGEVYYVLGGEVPEGTLAIRAERCDCGQWYISNHPRRKRCFMCRPYKKGR